MPTYEYKCETCNKEFAVSMSLSERDDGNVTCPDCKGEQVKPLVSAFTPLTSRKS